MSEYTCPQCKKPIHDEDALLCHFCGGSLHRSAGVMGKLKNSSKIIIGIIVGVVILSFIMTIF
jgi:hypothetical protein